MSVGVNVFEEFRDSHGVYLVGAGCLRATVIKVEIMYKMLRAIDNKPGASLLHILHPVRLETSASN